jgi:hypothetical protein
MPTRQTQRADPIVFLTTMPNEPIAEMWAETLRRNGIEVLVKPRGPGIGAWGSSFTFEHDLYVLKSDRRAALLLLWDLEGGTGEEEDEPARG